jgi:anti-sigma-K factor RskA
VTIYCLSRKWCSLLWRTSFRQNLPLAMPNRRRLTGWQLTCLLMSYATSADTWGKRSAATWRMTSAADVAGHVKCWHGRWRQLLTWRMTSAADVVATMVAQILTHVSDFGPNTCTFLLWHVAI